MDDLDRILAVDADGHVDEGKAAEGALR